MIGCSFKRCKGLDCSYFSECQKELEAAKEKNKQWLEE